MKIFQVKYNTEYYCYYKAEEKELINIETKIYKTYTDCSEDKNNIVGIENNKIIESLIKHFKK
jgi:hypothetical protein